MHWLTVDIDPGDAPVDALEQALWEQGAVSVSLCDGGDEPLLEPAPGETPLWRHARVHALFAPETGAEQVAAAVCGALGAEPRQLSFGRLEDREWLAEFRASLAPLHFGGRLAIVPRGQAAAAGTPHRIELEPGLAFGSGSHPTTAMCLAWLAGHGITGKSVLDYGCGSGILALAALALGAARATAVDLDPQALAAAADNARHNGLTGRLKVLAPGEPDPQRYDLIMANILKNTLVELAPALTALAAPGARLLLAGILAPQAACVAAAYDGWRIAVAGQDGDWVLLTGTRAG